MESWVISVISLIASTILTTIIGLVINKVVGNKLDKNIAEQKELAAYRAQQTKTELDNTIATAMKPLHEKIDILQETLGLNQEGIVTLMREFMKRDRDKFIERGYVTTAEVSSWHELYNTYKKLGGNHFAEYVDSWKEEIDRLPREPHHHCPECEHDHDDK